jgi:hypothetical protein
MLSCNLEAFFMENGAVTAFFPCLFECVNEEETYFDAVASIPTGALLFSTENTLTVAPLLKK